MPVVNFNVTATGIVIPVPARAGRQIRITGIWFEVSANVNLVSFRFGAGGADMFPKTLRGLAVMNLVGNKVIGGVNLPLVIFINGACRVRGTIIYRIY